MKKTLLTLSVAMMTLTACTQSEVVEEGVQSNAIGFDNIVSKNTRALGNSNFNTFWVYGCYKTVSNSNTPIVVFNNIKVTKQSDDKWKYDDTRYWAPNATYHFAAFSCENNQSIETGFITPAYNTRNDQNPVLNLNNFLSNNTHQHDLVYASSGSITSGADGPTDATVKFNFKHILSKLNVKFESAFAAGYELVIKDVKITNIRDKADYKSANTIPWGEPDRSTTEPYVGLSIDPANNIASVAYTKDDNTEVPAKIVSTGDAFVIPFTYTSANVHLEFKIDIKQGENVILSDRSIKGDFTPDWAIGKSYTYLVKISGTVADLKPIVFATTEDMNLDSWGTTEEVEFNFGSNVGN